MANHVYCTLRIEGKEEDLKRFYEENKSDGLELDFHKCTPPPPEGYSEYTWTVDSWGTKWNAQECESDFYKMDDEDDITRHYLSYQFFTAWDEPYGWLQLASDKYPHLEFLLTFEDEGWNHCGEHEAFNGVVDHHKYTYGDPEFERTYKEFEGDEQWEEFVAAQKEAGYD